MVLLAWNDLNRKLEFLQSIDANVSNFCKFASSFSIECI